MNENFCPVCEELVEVLVDWSRSELVQLPQRVATFCPVCDFTSLKVASMEPPNDGRFYRSFPVECRVCSREAVVVCPLGADEDNLECSGCGHMTAGEVSDEVEGDGGILV